MAMKSLKKATKQLASEAAAKPSDWPTSARTQEASKPSQAPARKLLAGRVKAAAPSTLPAPEPQPTKLPLQWQPAKLPGEGAAFDEAPLPLASPRIKVTFVLPKPDARHVSLCGEFNGWSPNATPMRRLGDGRWEATVALAPGRYQYKFIADGQWISDPRAHENTWNQHGTLNSVIEVRA